MVLFKKYYKAANDDIKTNRELIDKIFETAEKPSKTIKFTKIYKVGTAVAAVFVFAVGAFLYPQIAKLNDVPQLPEENEQVIENRVTPEITEEKPLQKNSSAVVQQENPVMTVDEPAPEIIADVENSGIATASEADSAQPFSIPEGPVGRMIDAPPVNDTKETAVDSFTEITAEETEKIQKFLKTTFGEKDEQTGNVLIFEVVGKSENMYLGRWRWWVNDHSSLLCEFVLNEELTEMYECTYTENDTVEWNTQNNLLNN